MMMINLQGQSQISHTRVPSYRLLQDVHTRVMSKNKNHSSQPHHHSPVSLFGSPSNPSIILTSTGYI